jgi:hypothetical protein
VGIFQDVTDRKEAQRALRHYANRVRILHDIDRTTCEARQDHSSLSGHQLRSTHSGHRGEPGCGHITHVVLREGHLWGDEEVTIPVSEIVEFEEGVVHLRLNKEQVEALPTIKMERAWS